MNHAQQEGLTSELLLRLTKEIATTLEVTRESGLWQPDVIGVEAALDQLVSLYLGGDPRKAHAHDVEFCDGCRDALTACRLHRCLKHIAVPQQNANESSGAECGGCIKDRFRIKHAADATGNVISTALVWAELREGCYCPFHDQDLVYHPEKHDDLFTQVCIRADGHEPPCNGLPRKTCPTLDNPKGGRHETPRDAAEVGADTGAVSRGVSSLAGDDLPMGERDVLDSTAGDTSAGDRALALQETQSVDNPGVSSPDSMDGLPPCGDAGCCVSTSIADTITAGRGGPDALGFFDEPCGTCERFYTELLEAKGIEP